jgi:hypothetical protein
MISDSSKITNERALELELTTLLLIVAWAKPETLSAKTNALYLVQNESCL